jgi:hypothetical protein
MESGFLALRPKRFGQRNSRCGNGFDRPGAGLYTETTAQLVHLPTISSLGDWAMPAPWQEM